MSWFDVAAAVTAFALVFPAELPDKTFVATLVIATRLRPLAVWVGVSAAFFVQCGIAVTAGGLLSLLPTRLVAGLSAALFGVGAVILIRGGSRPGPRLRPRNGRGGGDRGPAVRDDAGRVCPVPSTAFGVIFLAEWGDLSQLLTAGLAARTGEPVGVRRRLAGVGHGRRDGSWSAAGWWNGCLCTASGWCPDPFWQRWPRWPHTRPSPAEHFGLAVSAG